MCGICGAISISKNKDKITLKNLNKISQLIASRGPDVKKNWQDPNKKIALIVHRLSTQGLSNNSNQPCYSYNKEVISIMNGEIFNHKSIRKELIQKGYKFYTDNDTETVSNSFHFWGKKFIKKLEGQFAIFTYNLKKNQGLLIRDEHGISPLFYLVKNKKLFFSSTEDSLNFQLNKKIELNNKTLADFIISGSATKNCSIFSNIKQLEPGHYLQISHDKIVGKSKSFYNFKSNQKSKKINIRNTQKQIYKNLYSKVYERSSGNKNFGIFLSGGFDSTLILALLKKNYPKKKIITFTASFEDPKNKRLIGEHHLVKKICKHFKCKNIIVPIRGKDLIKNLGTYSSPESGILEYCNRLLAKEAKRNNIDVILSGEGSDEMFLGYDHNLSIIGLINKKFLFLRKKFKLRALSQNKLSKNSKIEDFFLIGGADLDLEKKRKEVFSQKMINQESLTKTISNYIKSYKLRNPNDFHKIAFLLDYQVKIPNVQLRRAEGPSMAEGVEMRFPFLNNELKKIVYNTPLNKKIDKSMKDKILLRNSFKNLIPNFLQTEKMPFGVPAIRQKYFKKSIQKFSNPPLKEILRTNLKEVKKDVEEVFLKKLNFLSEIFIRNLLNAQMNNKTCFFDPILWRLWSFAKWYKIQSKNLLKRNN